MLDFLEKIIYTNQQIIIKGIQRNTETLHIIDELIGSKKEAYTDFLTKCNDTIVISGYEDVFFDELGQLGARRTSILSNIDNLSKSIKNELKNDNFAFNNYLEDSLGYTRDKMPQVDEENIVDFMLHFSDKDLVSKTTKKLKDLKPSQNEFCVDKITNILLQKLKDDSKNKKYIISNDNYLLDGHHNWAAELEIDKNKKVECYKIDLPATQLIKRANQLKLTKQKDIDDNEIKKALSIVSLAIKNGDIEKSALDTTHLVRQLIMRRQKDGKIHAANVWVDPNKDVKKEEKRTYTKEEQALIKKIETLNKILNAGDIINAKYTHPVSKKVITFNNIQIHSVKNNYIEIKNPDIIYNVYESGTDGFYLPIPKDVILRIPKVHLKEWNLNNTITSTTLSKEEIERRTKNIEFVGKLKEYVAKAKDKGYSIYSDVGFLSEKEIQNKYNTFFAKRGYDFDPIEMFDECTDSIKKHFQKFGINTKIQAKFQTDGFHIDAFNETNGERVMSMSRSFYDNNSFNGYDNMDLHNGVYHASFIIKNLKHQGGGLAKSLFCSLHDQYKKMNLEFINVTAGLTRGPIVWPSLGFKGKLSKAENIVNNSFSVGRGGITKHHFAEQEADVIDTKFEGEKIFIKYASNTDEFLDVTEDLCDFNNELQQLHISLIETESDLERENDVTIKEDIQKTFNGLKKKYEYFEKLHKTPRFKKEAERVLDIQKSEHEIIQQEHVELAKTIVEDYKQANPNKKTFPMWLLTQNPIIKKASIIAFLHNGGDSYYVNMKDKENLSQWEERIGFSEYKNKKYTKQQK